MDLCMCEDKECKRSKTCLRFIGKADKYAQTYFSESPREKDGSCEYYWKHIL